ncbi:MAG: hypothetical protein U1E78_11765 [Gammaproteobacteria bacterium]
MISVNVNIKGLNQFQKSLKQTESNVTNKAQQALNRTLLRTRTQMTNAVGEKLNLKKKTIRELTSIQRATKVTGLIGKLIVKNKPVPLLEFNAKQNRKGVSFKIFKNRSRQLIKHSFITLDSKARDAVFKRESAARLKIKPLYGTRVTDVAKDKLDYIEVFAKDFISTELIHILSIR